MILNKYVMIVALCTLNMANSASGMSFFSRFTAPIKASMVMCAAKYWGTELVKCVDVPVSERRLLPEKVDAQKYPELARFIVKYRCSVEVEEEKDKHFIKDDFHRLINAERMRKVMVQEGLDRLRVADKCLCSTGDGKLTVLAKRVDFHEAKFSLEEVQQLAKLAEKTGFWDFNGYFGNVAHDSEGTVTFIDTEDRSFDYADPFFRLRNVMYMSKSTYKWLETYIQDLSFAKTSLPDNVSYDDEIDFEQVKLEAKRV